MSCECVLKHMSLPLQPRALAVLRFPCVASLLPPLTCPYPVMCTCRAVACLCLPSIQNNIASNGTIHVYVISKLVSSASCTTYHTCKVVQNRIYASHMTVYLVISLPKIPYIRYMVLANPMHMLISTPK
jgi:hypothetical protein